MERQTTALVAGGTSGSGLATARTLAGRGVRVTLACRDPARAAAAAVRRDDPAAAVDVLPLDRADLASVRDAAAAFALGHGRLDLLVNNAGVMVPPFGRTRDGFELQFGTNHLGQFALAAHLFPLLARTAGSRVVVVASAGANFGRPRLDDLNVHDRRYSTWGAYLQSKLGKLLFALELARRIARAGLDVRAVVAHPGGSATQLQRNSFRLRAVVKWVVMWPAHAARVVVHAAVDPSAANGS